MASWRREGWWGVAVLALALAVGALTFWDVNGYETSDPYLSLLVSQAVLEQGTVKLDAYAERAEPPFAEYLPSGPLTVIDGHYYYYFPPGSAALALPVVAIANWAGLDMARQPDNILLQELLSSLCCALMVPLLYALCREWVDPGPGLAITALSMLGTGLISTLGAAYWSIGPAALCALAALWMLARHEGGVAAWGNPYVLGALLFVAYVCRASMATLILAVFAYLLWRDRPALLRTAGTAALGLAGFLLFARYEYGAFFPQYYSVGRFQAYSIPVGTAALLHLFSPSRGMLAQSPFLLITGLACLRMIKSLRQSPLFWSSLAWVLLQLFVASRSTRWWGGHTFGSRILTEILPAWALWSAMAWRALAQRTQWERQAWSGVYLLLGCVAVFIHSYQGLYNVETGAWNGASLPPDVDSHPRYLVDWRYPQFAASREALCQRNRDYVLGSLREAVPVVAYSPGTFFSYRSGLSNLVPAEREGYLSDLHWLPRRDAQQRPALDTLSLQTRQPVQGNGVFVGWSAAESGYRWSQCETASILLWLDAVEPQASYQLVIDASTYGRQQVQVWVNERLVGELALAGEEPPFSSFALTISGDALVPQAFNEIRFVMPEAKRAVKSDARLLGMAFHSLLLYPGDSDLAQAPWPMYLVKVAK